MQNFTHRCSVHLDGQASIQMYRLCPLRWTHDKVWGTFSVGSVHSDGHMIKHRENFFLFFKSYNLRLGLLARKNNLVGFPSKNEHERQSNVAEWRTFGLESRQHREFLQFATNQHYRYIKVDLHITHIVSLRQTTNNERPILQNGVHSAWSPVRRTIKPNVRHSTICDKPRILLNTGLYLYTKY